MIDLSKKFNSFYNGVIYDAKRDLQQSRDLLEALQGIQYRTKKNGTPYAETEKNIITGRGVVIRHDRGFCWLDVKTTKYDFFTSVYCITFDAKKPFNELQADIERSKKRLEKEIADLENLVNMSRDEFYEACK